MCSLWWGLHFGIEPFRWRCPPEWTGLLQGTLWKSFLLQAHSPRRPEIRQGHVVLAGAQFSKRRCAFLLSTLGVPETVRDIRTLLQAPRLLGTAAFRVGEMSSPRAIKCIPEKLRRPPGAVLRIWSPLPDQLCGNSPFLKGQRRNRMAIRRGRGQSLKAPPPRASSWREARLRRVSPGASSAPS